MENIDLFGCDFSQVDMCYRIDLLLSDGEIESKTDVLSGRTIRTFSRPLTTNGLQKIYVYKELNDILYVGTTQLPIAQRLWYGKNRPYGYQFLGRQALRLYVWCFPSLDIDQTTSENEAMITKWHKRQIESIEAELVYLIRERKKYWPMAQNEIHFNNDFEAGRQVAEQMYEQLIQDILAI